MTHFYVPSTGADDWRWLLAAPGLHWKHGASAMALAHAWDRAAGWPASVKQALDAADDLADLELLLALPEHEVPLPGGTRASQTDLFVLARRPAGELVSIAVEGKVAEPFGDETVADWRAADSPGRQKRLAFLLDALGLADDDQLAPVRYQLLHRTASAVIEARRFGARHAVMLVHSFSESEQWFPEYAAFAKLFGLAAEPGRVQHAQDLGDVTLHLGWVTDPVPAADPPQTLSTRLDRALQLARELHATQMRKSTQIPYLAHLLGVASLVLEDGGGEDEAIAAVLHDAVEDQGGAKTSRLIGQLFGRRVRAIVDACSDTDVQPKPPWHERKQAYLDHLREPDLPPGTLRVSLADKVHNARSILFDARAGQDVFARFSASRDDTLWYYRSLARTFSELHDGPLARELARVVDELEALPG